jgi:hypothetical protein
MKRVVLLLTPIQAKMLEATSLLQTSINPNQSKTNNQKENQNNKQTNFKLDFFFRDSNQSNVFFQDCFEFFKF